MNKSINFCLSNKLKRSCQTEKIFSIYMREKIVEILNIQRAFTSQKIIEMGTGHKEVSHEMRNKYRQMMSLHTEVELTNTGAAPPQILLLGERRFFFLSGGFLVCLFCCCYLQSPWSIIWYQEWTITGN